MKAIRVLVCGGRDFEDRFSVYRELDNLAEPDEENMLGKNRLTVIHGDCRTGADRHADDWFVLHCGFHGVETYPANWPKYGNAAGPIRNQRMIDYGKPDIVLAFPGGRGTADMVRRAKEAGVKVVEVKGEAK